MNKLSIVLLVMLFATNAYSQQAQKTKPKTARVPQVVAPANSPVIRLTIVNDRNEILIRKTTYGWMTPAVRFNKKQNIQETLTTLAATYGIRLKKFALAGLFTYKYSFKPLADTRQFYVASYQSGSIISPKGETVQWMSKKEALDKLSTTVLSLGAMTRQVLNYPETLWGGAFRLSKKDGKLQAVAEADFYPLR